jgi:PAS domain S-box-containing protein
VHPLLKRQLKRLGVDPAAGVPAAEAWEELLQRVSRAYDDHDQERYLLERSQDLASQEMAALYATLRADRDSLDSRVRERTDALQLSEARLSSLLSLSADWIWEQDELLRFTYLSDGIEAAAGIAPSLMLGRRRMSDETFDAPAAARAVYEECIADRRSFRDFTYGLTRPDGVRRYIRISGEPVFDEAGVFRGYRGVGGDVTQTALAEQALRTSEERLQRALEASGLALWDFDLESGNVYLSESWSRLVGMPPDATCTTFVALADLVPESERAGLMACLTKALKDPHATYRVEHRVKKPDGGWLWNLSEGRVVERASDGRALRMVGTNRDITELKKAEDIRRDLESQLRESQKMEAIGTLAGGIAHDFNNILGAILGNVALAREEVGPAHPARFSLEQTTRAASRARGLVQQILAYSRHETQELVNRPLRPLVQEALTLMRSTLPAGVVLDADLPNGPLNVLADATQIQQVLLNLCTNAWHALEGRPGRVHVGLDQVILDGDPERLPGGLGPGNHAHLWVSDDGCGMDVATQQRIFEPFYTTKPVGRGTGLGLSVVHGIVTAHRGAITVNSRPGHGSTFHIYIPLAELYGSESQTSTWGGLEPLDCPGQGQRVLYIDDDEIMLLLVQRLLERMGYEATCSQQPHEAIAMVRMQPDAFDLVVSDFNMPHCSGLDVARALASIRADLPVVITSGYITPEMRADAQAIGVCGLIHKENTLEDLGSLVQRVLRPA